jgi:GNAT superfamily N-acetyltransferase
VSTAVALSNLAADDERLIARVAEGMRATLIEVEGEAKGTALYTMDWLRERVHWHLTHPCASVLLLRSLADERLAGYSIVRREVEGSEAFGLVSTTYVWPTWRRQGLAQRLLEAGEAWMREQALQVACTWTSESNLPLISLYSRRGYVVQQWHRHETTGTPMICLRRSLLPG